MGELQVHRYDHSGDLPFASHDRDIDNRVRAELFGYKIRPITTEAFAADYAAAMFAVVQAGQARAIGYDRRNRELMGLRPGDQYRPPVDPKDEVKLTPRGEYGEALADRWRAAAFATFTAQRGLERLLTLDEHVNAPFPIEVLQQAGISLELGHTLQHGDWRATKPLDEDVYRLVHSNELDKAGLELSMEYDRSDQQVQYSFTDLSLDSLRHRFIAVVRKRPVADFAFATPPTDEVARIMDRLGMGIDDLPKLEFAKRSSFIIAYELLSLNQRRAVNGALSDDEDVYAYREASAIVESIIAQPPMEQEEQLAVSPAMALYFDRLRIRKQSDRIIDEEGGDMMIPRVLQAETRSDIAILNE